MCLVTLLIFAKSNLKIKTKVMNHLQNLQQDWVLVATTIASPVVRKVKLIVFRTLFDGQDSERTRFNVKM